MPCGLGSCCMSMAISPPTTSTTCTSIGSKLQSLVTCSSTRTPQWQTFALWTADSRLTASLSTSFHLTAPQACTDNCLLTCQRSKPCCLPWTGGCHHMPSGLPRCACNVWDAHMGSVIPMMTTAVPFCYNWFRILKLVALTLPVSAPDLRNS